VQSHRAQGRESGFIKRNFIRDDRIRTRARGNARHQQPRHARYLGVNGKSSAGAGNAVAGPQIGDASPTAMTVPALL
jgi:hypothetical protein